MCGYLYLLLKLHKIKDNILTALKNGTFTTWAINNFAMRYTGTYNWCLMYLISNPDSQKQSNYTKGTTDFIVNK